MLRRSCIRLTGVVVLLFATVDFMELYAIERAGHGEDEALAELCDVGAARQSAKMRNACLLLWRERATPLVARAAVRAVTNRWERVSGAVARVALDARTLLAAVSLTCLLAVFRSVSALVPLASGLHPLGPTFARMLGGAVRPGLAGWSPEDDNDSPTCVYIKHTSCDDGDTDGVHYTNARPLFERARRMIRSTSPRIVDVEHAKLE
jgi:hypothetical protein